MLAVLLMAGTVGSHSLIVAVLVALLLAFIVGVVFHFFAPQYAAPAGLLTFLLLLVLMLV